MSSSTIFHTVAERRSSEKGPAIHKHGVTLNFTTMYVAIWNLDFRGFHEVKNTIFKKRKKLRSARSLLHGNGQQIRHCHKHWTQNLLVRRSNNRFILCFPPVDQCPPPRHWCLALTACRAGVEHRPLTVAMRCGLGCAQGMGMGMAQQARPPQLQRGRRWHSWQLQASGPRHELGAVGVGGPCGWGALPCFPHWARPHWEQKTKSTAAGWRSVPSGYEAAGEGGGKSVTTRMGNRGTHHDKEGSRCFFAHSSRPQSRHFTVAQEVGTDTHVGQGVAQQGYSKQGGRAERRVKGRPTS